MFVAILRSERCRRPDIICEVFEGLKIKCTECNETMAYGRWSRHFNDYHHENNSQDQVVDGNVEAEKQPQPKKRAEPKKKVEPKRATKKVATKEPKKTTKNSERKQRPTGS